MAIKKTKLLTMKVDEEEKAKWKKMASDRGITLAKLIRIRLNDLPLTPALAHRNSKTIIEVDQRLLLKINGIGNDLNKIFHRVNAEERFSVVLELQSIEQQMTRLLDAYQIP